MHPGNSAGDAIYFLIACFVLLLVLLACSLRLLHHGSGHVIQVLVAQNLTAILYYVTRVILLAKGYDPLCGGFTLFAGGAMWYTSLGLYYVVITQKTKALLGALFPKVPPRWFLAGQALLLFLYCVNVGWACGLVTIRECTVNWGGLDVDFVFTIIVQSFLLVADLVVYGRLLLTTEGSNKWVSMQLAYLQEAILLMVYLISTNIHIYYNWIPTVTYIMWYTQMLFFSYVSYTTIVLIRRSQTSKPQDPFTDIRARKDLNTTKNSLVPNSNGSTPAEP
ncbi:hypothetical protein HDU88_005169 [Geranomyces variabilis]|nr:hypothetical protein HDU88_005169 [Geranomyces variabilis]